DEERHGGEEERSRPKHDGLSCAGSYGASLVTISAAPTCAHISVAQSTISFQLRELLGFLTTTGACRARTCRSVLAPGLSTSYPREWKKRQPSCASMRAQASESLIQKRS